MVELSFFRRQNMKNLTYDKTIGRAFILWTTELHFNTHVDRERITYYSEC